MPPMHSATLKSPTVPAHTPPQPPGAKAQRSDGAGAKRRLLLSALKLFAEKGFAKTSTREIALATGANIAAISYYFGDKAGLYRAVFTEPLGSPKDDIARYVQPHFTLRQSLDGFYSSFLAPMKQGELVQQCMRLHFREMLEPTGLWAQELEQGIKPDIDGEIDVRNRLLRFGEAAGDGFAHAGQLLVGKGNAEVRNCRGERG